MFFGLHWIKTSAAPLSQYAWFKSAIFQSKGSNLFALGVGTILSFIVQSSPAVSVVAIAMTQAGVLPVDQTIMILYGTNIGSSLIVWFLSTGLKGTSKQIAMAQVAFNIFVGLIFVVLFYMELYLRIPLVKALVSRMSSDVAKQMAYVFFLFNFSGAVIFSCFLDPLYRFLNYFWPPSEEESKSKVKYIHDQALREPETAMDLAEKEQERLAGLIQDHLLVMRATAASEQASDGKDTHAIFTTLGGEILAFLNDLLETNLSGEHPNGC